MANYRFAKGVCLQGHQTVILVDGGKDHGSALGIKAGQFIVTSKSLKLHQVRLGQTFEPSFIFPHTDNF